MQHITEGDLPFLAKNRVSIFDRGVWIEEQVERVEKRHISCEEVVSFSCVRGSLRSAATSNKRASAIALRHGHCGYLRVSVTDGRVAGLYIEKKRRVS